MAKPLDGRVAVVTGGGGGIGSAVALELGLQGAHVVVADPGVSVEGEPVHEPTAAAAAERIMAAGGSAESSTVSVTDHDGLRTFFEQVEDRNGSLDIVVNTAGILRYPKLPETSEDDWSAVLDVHLNGYINVLKAALPMMVNAGHGRVIGFTSGVGLARTAGDAMVYGTAKRAVAALTWQLGPLLPAGVAVNAFSPIAATRMVRSTLVAEGASPRGLDLSAMPQPEHMAPGVAYLASERLDWCRGQVVFSAGSELSTISPPRLIEAVRTEDVEDLDSVLATVMPVVLSPAEADQRTGGGSNPRFGDVFSAAPSSDPASEARRTCLVLSDDDAQASALARALARWNMLAVGPGGTDPARSAPLERSFGFDAASAGLRLAVERAGPLDALIVSFTTPGPGHEPRDHNAPAWLRLLAAQTSAANQVMAHGAWVRAAARYAVEAHRTVRVIHVNRVESFGGEPVAQAVAQLARCVNDSTLATPLDVFSISLESVRSSDVAAATHLAARLAGAADSPPLRGAELVVGKGWLGLRSHPGPAATFSFGGPAVPAFVDEVLRQSLVVM
jgi:NAD(P)-dependent dehydrogenase (short-subunit alcohol dehydrogenase family)